MAGLGSVDYRGRLLRLELNSLELRRIRQDLVYTYKIVFGLVDDACSGLFTLTNTISGIRTRGHAYKLFPRVSRLDVRHNYFSERVVKIWNNLPAKPEHFRTKASFNRFICGINLSSYTTLGF